MLKLKIEKRDAGKKPENLRKKGQMPAVFYGAKEESTPITIEQRVFEKIWKEAGESSILSLEGVGEEKEALIHDVDVHPVTGAPRHADFYVIEKGKKLEVSVPLEFVGNAPAVKDMGGTLVKVLYELEIEVLPKDLPHEIVVDISGLTNFEKQIAVKDLKLPEGVTALLDPEEMVALVSAPKEEEEEESTEIDMESVEVEAKGKKEEVEEGSEGAEAPEKK